ncbi:hypothetical protein NDR87_06705 [Nocardia sp. CDC159]|uniref:Uncharacterized protein n=1 Tax=Nocardia pulmonis TaxID=2951408 RepID=A0A9X2E6P9_9NOCA|nr:MULTISPECIES: hypothetical protein [Nocardia]MCM6772651.1 hypothetical protein [Nocardia pulmonis]MCM6786046.1 hypothetical protein [Nocardia sp. CDC159]
MRVYRDLFRKSLVSLVAPVGLATLFVAAPAAVQTPTARADVDHGGGCVIYDYNPRATVESLRDRCTPEQQDQIFRNSPRGSVPAGVTHGWVTRPPIMQALAPPFWIGKTFYTGPNGGHLMNRITAAGVEGFPAHVYIAPSRMDGRPAWALDYTPSVLTPQIWDEIREIAPGVWFGYSYWRGALQTPLLLTFVLIR